MNATIRPMSSSGGSYARSIVRAPSPDSEGSGSSPTRSARGRPRPRGRYDPGPCPVVQPVAQGTLDPLVHVRLVAGQPPALARSTAGALRRYEESRRTAPPAGAGD